MPPIDTSALAAIFAWVWEEYGRTLMGRLAGAARERVRWDIKAQDYGEKVQRLYGTIQILGQPRPVPLEGIYTAVSLLDRPTALSRFTVEQMQAEFTGRGSRYFHAGDEDKRRDGLEMVREGENLFILGKPGAGKTTFLKHVALRGVKGELGRVPIFVGLKQLSDSGLSVFEYVVNEFDVCDFPEAADYLNRLLKAGRAILLFDGLDEVNVADDERRRLISDVENFTRKYDQCPRLITCRLAANDYLFQGYTYVEMADFDQAQIRQFVARWFGGDDKRRDLFLAELDKRESEGLRELARVPLLLALLCLGFEETLKLSTRRVELYEEALEALLKKWDAGRNIRRDEVYRELTLKRKEGMLAQVAAETFDRAEYFIPGATLARGFEAYLGRLPNLPLEIDGEVVLRAIMAQHGLFLERAQGIYSFAHLTFQEYFTARYVVENEARGTLPRLIEQYANPRYREVFLLTAAQLADAGEFFDLFIARLAEDAQGRPSVVALLRQAARKAATADGRAGGAAGRSIYVFLARALARALDLALARDRDSARALDFDGAFARARVRALAPDFDRALARNRALALALARARARARDGDLDRDLDRALDLVRDRNSYLVLARGSDGDLVLAHALDRARNLDRDLDLVLARIRARDHVLDRARALTRALDLDLALDLDRDLDRALDRARAPNTYPQVAYDLALMNAVTYMEVVQILGEDTPRASSWLDVTAQFVRAASVQVRRDRDKALATELRALAKRIGSVAGRLGENWDELEALSASLDAILAGRDLVFPALEDKDRQLLESYLDGNLLLLECLKQAAVADREAIKRRLLLLPAA